MDLDYEDIKEIDERADLDKRVLEKLLDSFSLREDRVLSVRANMGSSVSFVTSMSMKWLASNVGFAKNLPMWEGKPNQDGKVVIDEGTLEKLRQCEPDWRRQVSMVRYLACQEHHKFPPLLVAAWQEWVDNPYSDNWLNGRAFSNSVTETSIDSGGNYIDLDCSQTGFFALDGQHRLMAIKGLKELADMEHLVAKDVNGKPQEKGGMSLDDVATKITSSSEDAMTPRAKLQSLFDERIGVEIIPAIMMNETYEEAMWRLRSVLADVNKSAKHMTKGELAC